MAQWLKQRPLQTPSVTFSNLKCPLDARVALLGVMLAHRGPDSTVFTKACCWRERLCVCVYIYYIIDIFNFFLRIISNALPSNLSQAIAQLELRG